MWFDQRPVLRLAIISVAVHAALLAMVCARGGGIDAYAFNSLDCGEYYQIARNLVDHGEFSQSKGAPFKPDTWRTPGYPLFLAAVMLIAGPSPVTLIVVQQGLSILNVLLLFQIARRLMSSRRASVAALLFLFEPYHLLYSTWLMSTTLFVTLLLLTWYACLRARRRPNWTWFGLVGVLSGALVLVRPVGILVPVVILAWIVKLTFWPRPARGEARGTVAAWLGALSFAVALALVVGSWLVRNQVVAGHFALSDQGGVVLAYFKAAEVELWREGRTVDRYLETSLDPAKAEMPHTVWDEIDTQLQASLPQLAEDERALLKWPNLAQGNNTPVDSFEISSALARIGWSRLTDAPASTAACYLVRCAAILTFPLNLAIKPARGVEVNRATSALKAVPYVLLCVAVLVTLARREFPAGGLYLPLAITIALLLASTPQIDPRFRVPMIPLLVVVALLPRRISKDDV